MASSSVWQQLQSASCWSQARPEGVNRPELLPAEMTSVIDVAGFLTPSEVGDLNFNIGTGVDLDVPRNFWNRLEGKYGNKFYWQQKGEANSIMNAVSAIDTCLREEPGRLKCATVQGELGEEATSGPYSVAAGKLFKGIP
ncbi:MAG: hypothetical protein WDW38_000044 [Sanguina aurantia]